MRRLITAAVLTGVSSCALGQSDILQTAAESGDFDTLVSLIVAADLDDALDDGSFTVFAPTDEAFERLPEGTIESLRKPENRDALRKILTYHVIDFELSAPEKAPSHPVTTARSLEGSEITFQRDGRDVLVNGNRIVARNIRCSNGIIQVIDGVLLPPEKGQTIVEIASNDERFTTLVQAVKAAGLVDALSGETELTVLAPTDDAFAKLPEGTLPALRGRNSEAIGAVLKNHVIAGSLSARDLAGREYVETLGGARLAVSIENGSLVVGGSRVVINDIAATNGIVHVIDAVILAGGKEISDLGEMRGETVRISAGNGERVVRDGVRAERVEIRCATGGSITLTNVEADVIVTGVATGGDVTVSGRANTHEVNVASGASLDSLHLETSETEVVVASGGDVSVNASNLLEVEAYAGANVRYAETSAEIRKEVSRYATFEPITKVADKGH